MELKKALTDCWDTPPHLIHRVLALWGEIDLDPCSSDTSLVPATVKLGKRENGLSANWSRYGKRVYVNPPYDQKTLDLTASLCHDEARFYGCQIILLCPVKSDQEWFQRSLFHADAVCFIRGRVKYGADDKKHGAFFSSCLFYWGEEAGRFVEVFASLGWSKALNGSMRVEASNSSAARSILAR